MAHIGPKRHQSVNVILIFIIRKIIIIIFVQQTVLDTMLISVYNLIYTSMPVLALGILEQDVNEIKSLEYPRLYTPGLINSLFNKRQFLRSALHGSLSSLILFIIPFGKH